MRCHDCSGAMPLPSAGELPLCRRCIIELAALGAAREVRRPLRRPLPRFTLRDHRDRRA
jgi:hypothetical protein